MFTSVQQLNGRSVSFNARSVAGFSLFELVAFIIAVAIIYSVAANRFAEFPGQAERANFLAITTQLQSAINLEMMFGVGLGRVSSATNLEGANPMDLMLEPPSNYLGAFDVVDSNRIQRRVWFFDRRVGELVYLVNDPTGVFILRDGVEIPADELRFRIEADYGEYDTVTGLPVALVESDGSRVPEENRLTRLNGVVMRPVIPYRWGVAPAETLVDEALETSG